MDRRVRVVAAAPELQIVDSNASYLVLVAVGTIDIWLLYRFFSGAQQENGGAYSSGISEASRPAP